MHEVIPDAFRFEFLRVYLEYSPLRNQIVLSENAVETRKEMRPEAGPTFPQQKTGDFLPDFIGIIPTRGCNLDCSYCGFRVSGTRQKVLKAEKAIHFIEWYARLLHEHKREVLNIHFFGGEPFTQPNLCRIAVEAAKNAAKRYGMHTIFEAATNGFMNRKTAEFVRDSIDYIILSIDGPPGIQNRHRPRRNGAGSFDAVSRSARFFSQKSERLCLRCCITSDTVEEMVAIAKWFQRLRPAVVSFETLQESPESKAAGLQAPDPWRFASNFVRAQELLEQSGIETVYATADIHTRKVSFCPVGRDVAILSPDGTLSGCYLLPGDWEQRGMNLNLGFVDEFGIHIEPTSVERLRGHNVWNKDRCRNCFCKWHCAGGCHVNHTFPGSGNEFDDLCIQTRIISLYRLLKEIGRKDLFQKLVRRPVEFVRVILQKSDTAKTREVRIADRNVIALAGQEKSPGARRGSLEQRE